MHGTVEARKLWKVESAYNPWTHISHKELIYLLQKSTQTSKQSTTTHAPRGIDWQEKTIARRRPPLIRKAIKEHLCVKIVTQLLPYMHAMGIANFNTSIFQFHNYSTSTPLILPHLYLKTIHQASNFSQHLKFITKVNYHAVLKDSQNDISEA